MVVPASVGKDIPQFSPTRSCAKVSAILYFFNLFLPQKVTDKGRLRESISDHV